MDVSICKQSPSPQDRPMSSPHRQDRASQRWTRLKPVPPQGCSMLSSCVHTSDRGHQPITKAQLSATIQILQCHHPSTLTVPSASVFAFQAALAAFLSVSSSDRLLATFLIAWGEHTARLLQVHFYIFLQFCLSSNGISRLILFCTDSTEEERQKQLVMN